MHDVVMYELEDHLAGSASSAFHSHLASCRECSAEVESIARMSALIAELRSAPERGPEPPPFFFARVAANIVERQNTDHWGLLAPGAAFFRRIAFASLLVLAALGSYLVTREGNYSGTDAATVMAHDVTTAHPESSDRDLMLATLASYGE